MPAKGRFVGDFDGTKHGWFTEYSSRNIQIYVGDKGAAQRLKPFKRAKGQSVHAAITAAITSAYVAAHRGLTA